MITVPEPGRPSQETSSTPRSTWSPDISSGFPAMDELHQEFFASLNRLTTTPDQDFGTGYRDFVKQVERMFCREERWMEDIEFPMLRIHREQHARALAALHNVHSRVIEGDFHTARDVVEKLLSQWFSFHMSTLDAALALAMQVEQGMPSAPRRQPETIPIVP